MALPNVVPGANQAAARRRLLVVGRTVDSAELKDLFHPDGNALDVHWSAAVDDALAVLRDGTFNVVFIPIRGLTDTDLASLDRVIDAAPQVAIITLTPDDPTGRATLRRGAAEYVTAEGSSRAPRAVIESAIERQACLRALRDRGDRYRQMVETAQEGICTADIEHRTTFINDRLLQLLGYERQDVIGRSVLDVVADHLRDRGLALIESPTGEQTEISLRHRDGSSIAALAAISALHDAAGTRTGSLFLVTDITARKQVEQARAASDAMFRTLVEQSLVGVFIVQGGRFVYSNPTHHRIFGYEPGELVGASFGSVIAPSHRADVLRRLERRLAGMIENERYITRAIRKDAVEIDVEVHANRIEYLDRAAVIGTIIDVTNSRQAAEAQAHLAALVHSSPDAIISQTLAGVVTSWNPAAERMLGYRASEIVGQSVLPIVPEDRRSEFDALTEALRQGVALSLNTVRLASDGRLVPVSLSSAAVHDASGAVTSGVVIMRDTSESRAMELKLQEAERLSSLGRLAATMAHEFNNVLMGISPFAEVLAKAAKDERTETATRHIRASIVRGKATTDQILRFTRQAKPVLAIVDVETWLNSLSAELRGLLRPAIELVVRSKPGTGAMLAEAPQLSQVLTNLVINARDAMPSGGTITIDAQAAVSGMIFSFGSIPTVDRFVHVTVTDTGTGIRPDHLKQIFEPLFTTKSHGTGLGLSVVHKIVRSHGGEIFVESEVGKGSRFHIFIPQADPTAALASDPPPAARRSGRRVLIVEDDETVAAGLSLQLEAQGHSVAVVHEGAKAVPTIAAATPDVVVLDIGLPDVGGKTVYRQVRKRWPSLPVIFSTAHASRADIVGDESDEYVAFLSKPYQVSVLLEAIERLTRAPHGGAASDRTARR